MPTNTPPQLDTDAPSRDNPTSRNLRHYLAGNYTLATNSSGIVASDILPTASRLTVAANRFFPFTQFTPPNPQPNTGVHRFIYALYTQPSRFDTVGFESVGMDPATQNWNVSSLLVPSYTSSSPLTVCLHVALPVANATRPRPRHRRHLLHHRYRSQQWPGNQRKQDRFHRHQRGVDRFGFALC